MEIIVSVGVPLVTILLLASVGLDLDRSDFAVVRRQPRAIVAGLAGPLVILPPLALALAALLPLGPGARAGLLLIAACPIGGISNAYSMLARAATALSVTLTGLSSLLAPITVPAVLAAFAATGAGLGLAFLPADAVAVQVVGLLGLPVVAGMAVRARWPALARRHQPVLHRLSAAGVALLVLLIIAADPRGFVAGLPGTVPAAASFVLLSALAGWGVARLVRLDVPSRFVLTAEFATRNIAIATLVAVTLLGRVEFATFAATYFVVEAPLMLAAALAVRRMSAAPAQRPSPSHSRGRGLASRLPCRGQLARGGNRYNTAMDTSRPASRPRRVTVRRFASAAEADRHDLEYWHAVPEPERLLQVWRVSVELWRWRGEYRDEPGLCRSVASVRRP